MVEKGYTLDMTNKLVFKELKDLKNRNLLSKYNFYESALHVIFKGILEINLPNPFDGFL